MKAMTAIEFPYSDISMIQLMIVRMAMITFESS